MRAYSSTSSFLCSTPRTKGLINCNIHEMALSLYFRPEGLGPQTFILSITSNTQFSPKCPHLASRCLIYLECTIVVPLLLSALGIKVTRKAIFKLGLSFELKLLLDYLNWQKLIIWVCSSKIKRQIFAGSSCEDLQDI